MVYPQTLVDFSWSCLVSSQSGLTSRSVTIRLSVTYKVPYNDCQMGEYDDKVPHYYRIPTSLVTTDKMADAKTTYKEYLLDICVR